MKLRLVLILLLLLPITLAADDWVYSDSATIFVSLSGSYTVVPKSSDYSLSYIYINQTFFPKNNSNQKVLEFLTIPDAYLYPDELHYAIKENFSGAYSVNSKVETNTNPARVKGKVNFPLTTVPDDAKEYLNPTELIDSSNPIIVDLASTIAEGKSDEFIIANDLAVWVNKNINYNLGSMGQSATKKSSDVLREKEGVCTELTTLFISLARSIGIPARFVSGVSYTNSELFSERWGGHAWAEVYFPDYGWVAFDPTYGEYGYVDSSHVVSLYSTDAKDLSTEFQYSGKNVEVQFGKLKVNARLVDSGEIPQEIEIKPFVLYSNVGIGSYNIVGAEITNLGDYYVSVPLQISKVKEAELVSDSEKNIVLSPKSTAKVSWVVKESNSLDTGYIYTFPYTITTKNQNVGTQFSSSFKDRVYRLDELPYIDTILAQESNNQITINCSLEKPLVYDYEIADILCNLKNSGNTILRKVSVCMLEECKYVDTMGIGQENDVKFRQKLQAGLNPVNVKIKSDKYESSARVEFNILETPKLLIQDLSYPSNVSYNEKYNISIEIKKSSKSTPENTSATIYIGNTSKNWNFDTVESDKQLFVMMEANDLKYGKNDFSVKIDYSDMNGKQYEENEQFSINFNRPGAWQRLLLFFRQLFQKL